MAIQVVSTQDVVLIAVVWSMTQRGDDVFDDAFGQGRDRQEGIHFKRGLDDNQVRITK
ncbi:MAG TPA: hypothetical protein VFU37_16330 [Pyrinomonadaceae bacterium]|nr:hypothetical protein [Pyrinomonadaceae bacterium]